MFNLSPLLIFILLFVLGTLFGSFASAITHRIHTNDKSFWYGRSKCPKCNKVLHAKNLIPLVSFLLQRGKCKNCHKPISAWYPVSELVCGLLFTLPYLSYKFGDYANISTNLIATLILSYILIFIMHLIFLYDGKYTLIPDLYSFGLIIFGAILGHLLGLNLVEQLIGLVIGGGFFLAQYLISRGTWVGSGDILLGIGMGILLGPSLILLALFLSYLTGSFIGVFLIATGKASRKSTIPFGPFLMFGTLTSLLVGSKLVDWYLGLSFYL